ncbi:MAG: DUF134 domain-containing protein [Sphaerochaeta sp.]
MTYVRNGEAMPRQQRRRIISGYPNYWNFAAEEVSEKTECVFLSLDEFETIRLIDKENRTQEQCAESMGVARTTVTAIYDSARKKLAGLIVDGCRLMISGGQYNLSQSIPKSIAHKGDNIMRIAVTYENGDIFQHFGHTENFKFYDVKDGKITSSRVVSAEGFGHGALAGFLKQCRVDSLICGGIGMGAQMALKEAGITLYGGVSGNADDAVLALVSGNLSYNPNASCSHHEHEHGYESHAGEGHCGRHSCKDRESENGENSCRCH